MKLFKRKNKKYEKIKNKIILILNKIKLGIAVFLDLIDFVLGNIPILNTLWDVVTFFVLTLILKNKKLALFSNFELMFPGLPFFGQVDAFIPIATLLTILDITSSINRSKIIDINNTKYSGFDKENEKIIDIEKIE